jgi:hypothetical protein
VIQKQIVVGDEYPGVYTSGYSHTGTIHLYQEHADSAFSGYRTRCGIYQKQVKILAGMELTCVFCGEIKSKRTKEPNSDNDLQDEVQG